jgi:hypothetical protein
MHMGEAKGCSRAWSRWPGDDALFLQGWGLDGASRGKGTMTRSVLWQYLRQGRLVVTAYVTAEVYIKADKGQQLRGDLRGVLREGS